MAKKSGLGKGLDALFFDNDSEGKQDGGAMMVRLIEIEPNKAQPRKTFDENALAELADSIREHGIIQPLLVRKLDSGGFQLVAGRSSGGGQRPFRYRSNGIGPYRKLTKGGSEPS